jgi:hypothetical protein
VIINLVHREQLCKSKQNKLKKKQDSFIVLTFLHHFWYTLTSVVL